MFHQKSAQKVLDELHTNSAVGLNRQEVEKRLHQYGLNSLPEKPPPSILIKFISQFKSVLILVLFIATFLSLFLGDILDAVAIFSIVILNAAIGTFQEIKAEKTLSSLKEMDIKKTLCVRNGKTEKINVEDIVPGDILILEPGEKIPSDARIIESYFLTIDESILTGESVPVSKTAKTLEKTDIALGDRINMAFKNTQVSGGRGKAVVVGTGINTQIGKIAQSIEKSSDEKTPLTIELDHVGKMLTIAIIFISIGIFIITGLSGLPIIDRILIAVSLAVAAIPEGLPAIATITLALGTERLARKKTIVKKLPAVETLGSIRIIATDKTGTLTENKMNVTDIVTAEDSHIKIISEGYSQSAEFKDPNGKSLNPLNHPHLVNLLYAGVLANNAAITKSADNQFQITGDTTEGALIIACERAGISVDKLKLDYPRIFEIPFSENTKMMSIISKVDDKKEAVMFSKGAPEEILKSTSLSPKERQKILSDVERLSRSGLRVLAFAQKELRPDELTDIVEKGRVEVRGLSYLGLMGEKDTLRLEIREALEKAKAAGIKTIMITGDHAQTAASIAYESGIINNRNQVAGEVDIDNLNKHEIAKYIENDKIRVFARISPLGKLRLIEAMKLIRNTTIAVTGDGVNDAPALKSAHVGIAMGSGTDIAKEVSDLVITDDNYATIIDAVKEGRIIFSNLVKFIRYLISCNLAEVFVVALAVILQTPIPLIPIQLLWINLITDGLPAIALGNDTPEYDVMLQPPRTNSHLLSKKRWAFMLSEGLVMGISVFLLYQYALLHFDLVTARTMAFSALAITQLVHAFNNRSIRNSLFQLGIFSNKPLLIAVFISILLQFLAIDTHFGQILFKTTHLSNSQWLTIAIISLIPFFFVELKKYGVKKLKI